jgi:putative SOS response-associated peptidase YedK
VFALAGLWDRWEGDVENLESCSIIVMPANEIMKSLHERMPAIVARRTRTCGWTRAS